MTDRRATPDVTLEAPSPRRRRAFLEAVERSRDLHAPFSYPPASEADHDAWVARLADPAHAGFFVVAADTGDLAGVVNVGEIVRGCFQSAYLGYYAFVPYEGRGYMSAGLALVISYAFDTLGLHRLEANIQPENAASIELVRRLGFRREGFSPRYLRIGGEWRDHERWAILSEG